MPHPPLPIVLDNGVLTERYRTQIRALADWYVAECGRAHRAPDNAGQWALAVAGLREVGFPWEEAYAGYRLGQAHLRQGHGSKTAAAAALRRATAVATRLLSLIHI